MNIRVEGLEVNNDLCYRKVNISGNFIDIFLKELFLSFNTADDPI